MALAALTGCDQGSPDLDPTHGPPLHVIATFPSAGEGTECGLSSPDDCGVPGETTFELRFDRYLLPSSVIRQAVNIYTGSEDLGVFAQPDYDVVERVVVYRLPKDTRLEPGVRYSVEILIPKEDGDDGFRAFDGAPLAEGEVPLSFDFRTRKSETSTPAPASPKYDTTCDLLDALAPRTSFNPEGAGCSGSSCHGGKEPRMGLRLINWQTLEQTAIGKVAHQTDTGTGKVLENPPQRLGANMPIIDRGNPGNSYLIYKLLRNPNNFSGNPGVGCTTLHNVPLPSGTCPEPSAAESERLASYFVRGVPMPYDDVTSVDLRRVQGWVRDTNPLDPWYPCQTCGGTSCGKELTACSSDDTCKGAFDVWTACVRACGNAQLCADTFVTKGGAQAQPLYSCTKTGCAAQCGL